MLKRKSRILEEVYETARGLYDAGLIDKRRMREFDALCHLDVHEIPPGTIKALRERARVSQAVFAAIAEYQCRHRAEVGDWR